MRVLNIAHRGASHDAPENTLAAVRAAVAQGADVVEVDVHRTADGVLVVHHDAILGRTTDAQRVLPARASRRLGDHTLETLRRLDAGSWKHSRHTGERVPTLGEVLDVLAPSGAGVLVELKAPELYPGLAHDVAAELRGRPALLAERRVVVQSFDESVLVDLRELAPDVPLGLLGAPARAALPGLVGRVDQVNPRHLTVDRAYVDHLHDLGLTCHVWTVNRAAGLRRALGLGVDGVITNRPLALGTLLDALRKTA
jgi:glycerophosphoryl diester phosphodiesterase